MSEFKEQSEEGKKMPKTKPAIDEKALTKGELRKLNALKKSIGDELGNEAFAKWLAGKENPNIELIEKALDPLIEKIRIPRGSAYAVRRGRGRFIVEAVTINS